LLLEGRKELAYHFLHDMKDYQAAAAHFGLLAERYHQLYPQGSEIEGVMLYMQYVSQADKGWWTEAERTRTKALAVNRVFSREDRYRFLVRLLVDEGWMHFNHGKLQEAAALFKEAGDESRKGERWWVTGVCDDRYIATLLKLGKRAAAGAALEESLAYLEEMMKAKAKHERLSATDYRDQACRLAWLTELTGEDPQQRQKAAERAMRFLQSARVAGFNDARELQELPGWAACAGARIFRSCSRSCKLHKRSKR
jgi:hypothetical protein